MAFLVLAWRNLDSRGFWFLESSFCEMESVSGPDKRIMPIAPEFNGVEIATIVSIFKKLIVWKIFFLIYVFVFMLIFH